MEGASSFPTPSLILKCGAGGAEVSPRDGSALAIFRPRASALESHVVFTKERGSEWTVNYLTGFGKRLQRLPKPIDLVCCFPAVRQHLSNIGFAHVALQPFYKIAHLDSSIGLNNWRGGNCSFSPPELSTASGRA
jgi:hypothetical protein